MMNLADRDRRSHPSLMCTCEKGTAGFDAEQYQVQVKVVELEVLQGLLERRNDLISWMIVVPTHLLPFSTAGHHNAFCKQHVLRATLNVLIALPANEMPHAKVCSPKL